jgi:hypothetical protein
VTLTDPIDHTQTQQQAEKPAIRGLQLAPLAPLTLSACMDIDPGRSGRLSCQGSIQIGRLMLAKKMVSYSIPGFLVYMPAPFLFFSPIFLAPKKS